MKKIILAGLLALLPSLQAASDLAAVFANMDGAASTFEGMKADIQRVNYTAIVDDKSVEDGEIRVVRDKNKQVTLLMEIKDPAPLTLAVKGTKAEIYRPRIAQVEEYDLSESKSTLEQAFSLGFGTSGSFLKENYDVKVLGEEDVAGQPTVKLELIPKSAEMLKRTPRIEMWISTENWNAVQQKVYEVGSGDYSLNTYSKVSLNPGLKESELRLKVPKNTKRVFPQH